MPENGKEPEGWRADPQAVINNLMNRIANLTMELAVKDAYISALEEKEAHPLIEVES